MAPETVVDPKLEEKVEPEEKAEEKKEERTVPLGVLLEERRERQGREAALQEHIEALNKRLEAAEAKAEKKAEEAPADETERTAAYWRKKLGVDELREQLVTLTKRTEKIDTIEKSLAPLQEIAQSTFEQRVEDMETLAREAYDKKGMNCTGEEWEELVAGLMTPELTVRIGRGSKAAAKEVIEKAKKLVTVPAAIQKAREAAHVRALPKGTAPGGSAPGIPQENKPFTSLRDLHKEAAQDFFAIVERDKG